MLMMAVRDELIAKGPWSRCIRRPSFLSFCVCLWNYSFEGPSASSINRSTGSFSLGTSPMNSLKASCFAGSLGQDAEDISGVALGWPRSREYMRGF